MNGISVNTNNGAMQSLQYLNNTNAMLNTVQNAINSGMTVADAQDNGAVFAIAQNMRGDVAGYSAVSGSLSRATSSVDVALSAGQSISDLLIQMKSQALSASNSSLDTASRQALNENFQALLGQIKSVVTNAQFNGVNLIDGSTKQITALASTDGSHRDHRFGGKHEPERLDRDDLFDRFDLDPVESVHDDLDGRNLR